MSKSPDKPKNPLHEDDFKKPRDLIDLVVKHNLKLVIDP